MLKSLTIFAASGICILAVINEILAIMECLHLRNDRNICLLTRSIRVFALTAALCLLAYQGGA